MSGFNFFNNQKDKQSDDDKNQLIEFSSSEGEEKKEDVNPLDMFADSALADANNNNDIPLIGDDLDNLEEEDVSYTDGSIHSEEDYLDVEDGEEFISQDENGKDDEQMDVEEEQQGEGNNSILERAMQVAAQSEEEPVPHFDKILSDVSQIKNENKEQELTEKNKFLLTTVMKLSQQASHFKNRVSDNILEKHQLVEDLSKQLEQKDSALENLQVDIEEMEQDLKDHESQGEKLKKKYANLKNSKDSEIYELQHELIEAESFNKRLQSEKEIQDEHSNNDKIKIGTLEEDNSKLRRDIEILNYKINTTEQSLKSEIEFKDLHINKLQSQIQSFHQIGLKNNVSVDDYNTLIESFKESTDEIDRLKAVIEDRELNLKMLLSNSLTDSTDDSNSIDILKKELMLEKLEKDTLSKQLKEIVQGLESTLNESKDYKKIIDTLEAQLLNSNSLLESVENDRNEIFNESIKDKAAVEKLEKIIKDRDQLIIDLSSQVQYVLLQLTLRTDSDSLSILTKEEINKIKKLAKMNKSKSYGNKNIQDVITDNLVLFKDINDLQSQNQNLVVSLRELGNKLEALQAVKEQEDLTKKLKTKANEYKQEIKVLEDKKQICQQELENLNKLIETNKDYKSKAQTNEVVMNYKVQIEHLEKQLDLALDKVLKSSEDSNKSLIDQMSKITSLNIEISDLKSLNKSLDTQLKQSLKDKEVLTTSLAKEQTLRDDLHQQTTELLKSNQDWEHTLKQTQESLTTLQSENVSLSKSLTSLKVENEAIQKDNVKLNNKVQSMSVKMDRIEGLRKEVEYLLRHSDEDYWENLALLEKKVKNNEVEDKGDDKGYDSVKHILEAFEKHMSYHNNQAKELRGLLKEKNDVIEKLNVDNRVNELVEELDHKKKEYEDLQNVLDEYKKKYEEEKVKLDDTNVQNLNQLNELKAQVDKLNAEVEEKNGSISEFNGKVVALQAEIEESKKSLDSLNSEFKQKVRNLEIDYDELEHTCKEYEERNKSLVTEKEDAVNKLEELTKKEEEEVTALKKEIETLKEDLATKSSPPTNQEEISKLNAEIEELKKQIDIKSKTDSVNEIIDQPADSAVETSLRSQIKELTESKSSLESKIKTLEAENRDQRASVLKVKLLEQKLKMLTNTNPSSQKGTAEPQSVPAFNITNKDEPTPAFNFTNKDDTFTFGTLPEKQTPAFLSHDESKDSSTTAMNTSKRALEKDDEQGEKKAKTEPFKFDFTSPLEQPANEQPVSESKESEKSKESVEPAIESSGNGFKFDFGKPAVPKDTEEQKKSVFGFNGNPFSNQPSTNAFGKSGSGMFGFGGTSRFEGFAPKKDDDKKDEEKKE